MMNYFDAIPRFTNFCMSVEWNKIQVNNLSLAWKFRIMGPAHLDIVDMHRLLQDNAIFDDSRYALELEFKLRQSPVYTLLYSQ